MADISTAEIRLTQNKDALAKLRRLKKLVVDQYGERYDAMTDGQTIPFWVGQVRTLPLSWANGLRDDCVMPLDGECKHCKGKGATIAGACHKCDGTGWVDLNTPAPLFKILSQTDPLVFNPAHYQGPPKPEELVSEKKAAEALA